MALERPTPPPEITTAFSSALPNFLGQSQDGMRMMGTSLGEPLNLPTLSDLAGPRERVMPHDAQQVFILPLQNAAEGAGPGAMRPVGWRIFAGYDDRNSVLGSLRTNERTGWKMTSAHYGGRAQSALQAADALNRLDEVKAHDYELRVLAVPSLSLEAYWLVAREQGVPDLVVPYPLTPDQKKLPLPLGVYTMAHFLAAIRPLAIITLSGQPPEKGGPPSRRGGPPSGKAGPPPAAAI
jgi:hypothetical protein